VGSQLQIAGLAFDKASNVISITDPLNHATTFGYDPANRMVSVTNALGKSMAIGYDANNNRTSITDALNHTTTATFDKLNRPTTLTNALNEQTKLGYDANNNRTSITNGRGATWTTTYDNLDRSTKLTDPLSHSQSVVYDASTGDVAKTIDALGYATLYGYDDLGRQISVSRPTDGKTLATTNTAYDADNRLVSVTDPMSNKTYYGYDNLNRVVSITNPLSQVTLLGYDANDNRTWLQDALSNKTSFTFDKLNRLTAETDPLGKSLSYAYDDASRLVSTTDRQGRQRAFGYDAANHKTSETWYAAGGSLVQSQTFGYDAGGNLVSANDPDGNYTITRDALNRAASVVTPSGVTLTFAYDAAGNRTSAADSKGGVQTSTYDLANRVTSRTLHASTSGDARIDYTYTARNETQTVSRFSDLAGTTKVGDSAYTFDAGGRLVGLQHHSGSGATLANYAYQYDLDNCLTQKTENGTTTTYGYDKLGEITSENGKSYSYDASGNRTMAGYVTAADNRTTNDGTWAYSYNADGQVTSKAKAGESWTYTYDHRGQMTQASNGTTTVNYQFDALGNRIRRSASSGGTTTVEQYVVDGWDTAKPEAVGTENFDTVMDLDGSGTVTGRRLYDPGVDLLGVRVDGGGAAWHLGDRQGSVRAVTNSAGVVMGTRGYDGFGQVTSESGSGLDRYGYTGRENDATLGLQYNRGRMYNAATGRWMSEDPIRQQAGDANLYRYVGNSPTNATDPSGLEENSPYIVRGTRTLQNQVHIYRQRIQEIDRQIEEYSKQGVFGLNEAIRALQLERAQLQRWLKIITPKPKLSDRYYQMPDLNKAFIDGLKEGFDNFFAAVDELTNETAELLYKLGTDPEKFAKEVLDAATILTNDKRVREKLLNEFLDEWRSNPSKALIKAGLSTLCGAAGDKAFQAIKTLVKARAHAVLKKLQLKFKGESPHGLDQLANKLDNVRTPEELQQLNNVLDEVEKTGRIPLVVYQDTCFVAGTPILTPDGHKFIEDLRPGDLVLSRSEFDAQGPVKAQPVEELFTRVSRTLKLYVEGRMIQTTPEHPFWMESGHWLPASELKVGMRFLSHTNELVELSGIVADDVVETVYNVRVAVYHTYFVGCPNWGFSVWAHNARYVAKHWNRDRYGIWDNKKNQWYDASCREPARPGTTFSKEDATREAHAWSKLDSDLNVPSHAKDVADHIDKNGVPPTGHRGGGEFANDGRPFSRTTGEPLSEILPQKDARGRSITYTEYDVRPFTPGVNRGRERIVIGSDGRKYYTNDHYNSFTEILK
jgi:RHS repeat-associated protein